eukprot:GFYU01003514.1.p1 GENE.GFYU01003514.1~~GFYU01003514.1.p1  ORF type:complete len:361 (-),score=78.30 GFYU01003514.1:23-1060(-)
MSTLEFHKYPKLKYSPEGGQVEAVKKWVATEKVHGSNFSIYWSGGDPHTTPFTVAKRTGFLTPKAESEYYNYKEWLDQDKNKTAIAALYDRVAAHQQRTVGTFTMTVYGELFGGWYPTEEQSPQWRGAEDSVPPRIRKGRYVGSPEAQAVQEGIYYCPTIEFYVFDVAVEEVYLSYEEMHNMCQHIGLLHAQPLKIGTLSDVMEYSLEFDSTVPPLLGLHRLPAGTNTAEGIVIRPYSHVKTRDADRYHNFVFKMKHSKFSEVKSEGVQGSSASGTCTSVVLKYATKNRYDAVVSKLGPGTGVDVVRQHFIDDVWESFYEEHYELDGEYKAIMTALDEEFNILAL